MSWIGAAITGAASLLGGFAQQKASQSMAREEMEFQERMSSTAHQREVQDLQKAGLNPILSTRHGGASSPSGSMGTAVDIIGNAARTAVNTGMAADRLESEIDVMKEQANLSKQDQMMRGFQRENLREDTLRKIEEQKVLRAEEAIRKEELEVVKASAAAAKADQELFKSDEGEFVRKIGTFMRQLMPAGSALNSARSLLR